MNYRDKRVGITGVGGGFLADALSHALSMIGHAEVVSIYGDIRNPSTFSKIDYSFDYLFHFAAPSSQILFKQNPVYCAQVTINGFINAAQACRANGVKLIYPSTGVLSQGATNEYARCKQICEDLAPSDALGLRIFATYGPGEGHKRDYASVPYLFARDIVNGKNPVIFGNGKQVRDFIYIDDVVNAIMVLAEECNEPVVNVGSGKSTSFIDLVREINDNVKKPMKAEFIEKPDNYVQETAANVSVLREFYKPKVSLKQGIKEVIKELTS